MKDALNLLLECMNRENQILHKINDLALKKREVIILGDVKELNDIIRREASLLNLLEMAEAERIRHQADLSREHGFEAGNMTAAELQETVVQKFYRDCEQAFAALIQSMTASANSIKRLNQENAELLNYSLAYIETIESILFGTGSSVYSPSGSVQEGPQIRKILDKRL